MLTGRAKLYRNNSACSHNSRLDDDIMTYGSVLTGKSYNLPQYSAYSHSSRLDDDMII